VCEVDSFCCTTQWDDICVNQAINLCSNCGEPGAGNCFAPHATSGCDLYGACSLVCDQRPSCCEGVWDEVCASIALWQYGDCGWPDSGSCLEVHPGRGCSSHLCCQVVCAADPFCCSDSWDNFCVSTANQICATCGGEGAGPCYYETTTPSCGDPACCEAVCAADPFCCENNWDQYCVRGALYLCYDNGIPEAGDCYSANGTPGCNSLSCSDLVCEYYAPCCTTEWDDWCANVASQICCPQDCVAGWSFTYPNDGVVDGADLAVLLTSWGRCKDCCADSVNSAFQPIPDGVVNGADLGVLLTTWGNPGCSN